MELTTNDFSVGDLVMFGRQHGEQTRGEVMKVNGKKIKVKQTEARGAHRVGTIWTVPPSLCQKLDGIAPTVQAPATVAPQAKSGMEDVVSFALKARLLGLPEDCLGKTIVSCGKKVTIVGIDMKRHKYPVLITGVQGGQYILDVASTLSALGTPATPTAPVNQPFALNTRVWFKSLFGRKGLCYGMIVGYAPSGRAEILTTSGILTPEVTDVQAVTINRSQDDLMADILSCYGNLSPESLSCDGEASRAHVMKRASQLNRYLRSLFAEIGRTVSEEDAYKWYDSKESVGVGAC